MMPSMTSDSGDPVIVSNTTPISELAKIGRLNLLCDLYGRIFIPQEVFTEVTTGAHPAAQILPQIDWIEVRAIADSQKIITLHNQTKLGLDALNVAGEQ
jgi:predicted nucleic acid-binding protein